MKEWGCLWGDVAQQHVLKRLHIAQQGEVGRTAVDMALLVDHRAQAEVLQEFLQRGAERVLDGETGQVETVQLFDIRGDVRISGHKRKRIVRYLNNIICGAYRTRTDHLNIANVALYRMS